jgi:Tol biopolymer transport system component
MGPISPSPLARADIAFVSNRSGSNQIYVANTDGLEATPLATGERPSWSRDGQRIAFDRTGTVYVMNADGSGQRALARGYWPAWSPDGTKIVFSSVVADGRLFIMNDDGSVSTEIFRPEPGYSAFAPNWSPDGQWISFIYASYDDSWRIRIIKPDGSGLRTLFVNTADSRPVWSPDGSRILHSSSPTSIESVDLNGVGRIEASASRYIGEADWLPDGRNISYSRFTGPGDSRSSLGSRMRIFVLKRGVEQQLIPEATSPANSSYWDEAAVSVRTR